MRRSNDGSWKVYKYKHALVETVSSQPEPHTYCTSMILLEAKLKDTDEQYGRLEDVKA